MKVTYSGPEAESVWVTGREEIDAHLVYLAAEIASINLTRQDKVVYGRVDMPLVVRFVPFEPDSVYEGALPVPPSRVSLRLDYRGGNTSFRFYSRVVGCDDRNRWLLLPPRAIRCTDRRIVHRHRVVGDPAFELRLKGPWQPSGPHVFSLLDLSSDGLAFLFHPRNRPLKRGTILSGTLRLPSGQKVPLLLRVAHLRKHGEQDDDTTWVAGVRFLNLSLDDRMRLARGISRWELVRSAGSAAPEPSEGEP